MLDAVTHESAAEHGDVGARYDQLDHVVGLINPAGGGEARADLAEKNSDPAERQSHVGWHAEGKVRRDLHFFQIDVWLVKAVEQNKRGHTERVKRGRHVCEVTEIRT